MAHHVKDGNEVVVVLGNDVAVDDLLDFIGVIKKRTGTAGRTSVTALSELKKCSYGASSVDVIVSVFKEPCTNDSDLLAESIRILKPSGTVVFYEPLQKDKLSASVLTHAERISNLKLAGFNLKDTEYRNIDTNDEVRNGLSKVSNNDTVEIVAEKPAFEIGSSVSLSFGKKETNNVWKLDDAVDDDLIDEDTLLDEDDIVKPDASSLRGKGSARVCATTGKRKACKDCSCGLAEELSGKAAQKEVQKSSCGNCYLGDAFRCASCPYLGMPAFKPGEKVVLPETQLSADS